MRWVGVGVGLAGRRRSNSGSRMVYDPDLQSTLSFHRALVDCSRSRSVLRRK